MVNLSFFKGTSDHLKNLSSIQNGAFYLSEDSHKLYIGQENELVELNKNIIIIDNISDLPDNENNNLIIEDGLFYYISSINALCIFKNNNWIQINPDTKIKDLSTNCSENGVITFSIQETGTNMEPHEASITPEFIYGKEKHIEHFDPNCQVTFDVYSTTEIDNIINDLKVYDIISLSKNIDISESYENNIKTKQINLVWGTF